MYTVLIVDDVPAMAEQYAYDLRRLAGMDARIALSGDDALELVASEALDGGLVWSRYRVDRAYAHP